MTLGPNTRDQCRHLNDAQFGALLAGQSPRPAVREHLAACDHCRLEVEAVLSAVEEFNALSLSRARRRAPRMVPTPSRLAQYLGGRPIWGLGVAAGAAGFLVALGLSVGEEHPRPSPPVRASAVVPTTGELAQDNRLMLSIDQELRSSVEPAVSASELGLSLPNRAEHREAPVSD